MTTQRQYDAIVVGASLGGLVSAALLARRGYRVAVVEQLRQPGGRCGSIDHRGYSIPFGHRDGHGVGDNVFGLPLHFMQAARAAGAEVHARPLAGGMRIHRLPAQTSHDLHLGGRPGTDRLEAARQTVQALTGHDEATEESAKAYLEATGRLGALTDTQQKNLVPMTLGDWLDGNVSDDVARTAILQLGEVMFPSPSERTSVGRLSGFLKESRAYGSRGFYPEDPDAVGMQGLVSPWLRVIEQHGGELWLGWKPIEIVIDERRVRGVVACSEANLVLELQAPVVVTDYPGWMLREIIDRDLLPSDFEATAERILEHCNDFAGWWAGLGRLPTRRSDGLVEDMPGWHRVLWGDQAVKRYHGAFQFASCHSQAIAPAGKHLLEVVISHWGEGEGRHWRRWGDARASVDRILDYVHWYYTDLAECVEWSEYQYLPGPEMRACYLKPVARHPVKVATIEGLYMAGSTSEGTSAYQDLECEAAMRAVELVESEMGRAGATDPLPSRSELR